MIDEHAYLAPSSMNETVNCPGAPWMQAARPEARDTEDAIEGRAAHWCLTQSVADPDYPLATGMMTPEGVAITPEMMDGVDIMHEFLDDGETPISEWATEQRVGPGAFHQECWGTIDLNRWQPERGVLDVAEYKFGHARHEPYGHYQLLTYVGEKLHELGINGDTDQHVICRLTVGQPRDYHNAEGPVRTWTVRASDLRGYFNIIRGACEKAMAPDAKTVPGGHCMHCSARAHCSSAQKAGLWASEFAGKAVPMTLPLEAMMPEYRMLKFAHDVIKARLSGLEELAVATMRGGKNVPGMALEPSAGREQWIVPYEQVLALGEAMQVDLRKQATLTPAQARKAGIDPDTVAAFAKAGSGTFKLTTDGLARIHRGLVSS